ncbi:class I SAM-dependent methyltransferase [bacterium]|nr:class I SAM-dependent methyltransferase [bacterium]
MSLKNNFKKHQAKWQRMGKLWAKFSPSGRPSKDDIKNYNRLLKIALKDIEQPKVVLLGSTPEIRNLLYKYKNVKVYCVDMTEDMYQSMKAFIKHKNSREKFIRSNWLEMSKKIKDADVVIGDYVSGNIGAHLDKFLLEIQKILKPNGYFIVREMLIVKSTKPIKSVRATFKRVINKYEQGKLNLRDASSEFASEFILKGAFLKKNSSSSISYFEEDIRALFEDIKNKGSKSEKRVLSYFKNSWWQIKDKYWIFYTKEKQEKFYTKYFQIRRILYSNDYKITKESPIYLLQK